MKKALNFAMHFEDTIALLETYVAMARDESLDLGDELDGLRKKQARVFALMAGAQTQIGELKKISTVTYAAAKSTR